jgi:TP901 family phage tail tape measure protein
MSNLQLNVNLKGIDNVSRPLRNVMGGAKELAQQLKDTRQQLNQLNNIQKNVDGFIQLRKQFEEAKNKTKSLAIELKNTATPTKALQREFNKATAETKKLKDKLTPLRAELHQSGVSTKNLTQHQITLKNQITSVNQSIGQQSERLKQLNLRQQKISQIRSKYDTGMQRVAVLGGVGYGALATGKTVARGMKNLLHVGYEFDASMSATQAVTRINDKNDPRMFALRQQARTLPLQSKFTDSEVAAGQYFLGRTGYNADQILKAMPGMLNLASAGDLDLGTTADIASNIQMAMGIPAEKMDHVADVMTAMFTRNNVDIQMLGESLKYSAGIGAAFGQSLETVAAATAMMGNAGIQGSQAGTTLRQILTRIGTSEAVAKLGVKTKDKNGNMRDLVDILAEISAATQHMGNVDRAAINKKIAGQIGLTGFEILLSQSATGELKKLRGEKGEYEGEAARVAGLKLDNLKGDMTMLHAAFENISVELFEKNNAWLRKAIQGFTHFLHSVGEFLKRHPAVSKGIVMLGTGLAALTTAFGGLALMLMSVFVPMLMTKFILSRLGLSVGSLAIKNGLLGKTFSSLGSAAIGLATSPLSTLSTAVRFLGSTFAFVGRLFLTNPIGLVITAIAVAALLIYKYWEPIKAFFIGVWEGFTTAMAPVKAAFEPIIKLFEPLAPIFNAIGDAIGSVINWFSNLFEPVHLTSEEFEKAKSAGVLFGETLGKTLNIILTPLRLVVELFEKLVNFILTIPEKIDKLKQSFSEFFNNPNGLWDSVKTAGKNMGAGLWNGMQSSYFAVNNAAYKMAVGAVDSVKSTLGIHSPSRVFAKLGAYTVEGFQNGIERNQSNTLHTMSRFASKINKTGAQINGGIIAKSSNSSAVGSAITPQYYITINATPGMNEQELARCVAKEIERRERNQSARYRSSLRDID